MAARPLECAVRLSRPVCISSTDTLSLRAAVIIIAGSVPSLNVKALCANFLLLTGRYCWTIIFSLVLKIILEPSLTYLNAKNKGQSSEGALRPNFSNLDTSTCYNKLSLNRFSLLMILLTICLLLNMPLISLRWRARIKLVF